MATEKAPESYCSCMDGFIDPKCPFYHAKPAALSVAEVSKVERQGEQKLPPMQGPLESIYDALIRNHREISEALTETTRLRSQLAGQVEEIQRLRGELARERRLWCDQPEDRLYHASDKTWWKREDNRPIFAEAPPEIVNLRSDLSRLTAENQELRQVVKEYRQSNEDHREDCWENYKGTDIRCDTCLKADLLLAQSSPAREG